MRLTQPAWPRALPATFVVNSATLGPIGRRLPAPGTWGSLAGLIYFWLVFRDASGGAILVASLVGGYLAVALCGEAEVRLGRKDPGEVILDEFIVMPLCFLGWHACLAVSCTMTTLLAGFALFRIYDILKPFGIRRLQSLPGGWGVVADDVAAALAACATLQIGAWVWMRF